ncbi:MAG TPA: phosphoethanolamine--lipid A transferase [Burkholderiales bacterium]|nr:phosphoethanolamine--lipid A transferase [Burkholderiales bacterium]
MGRLSRDLHSETLAFLASVFFALACNARFWSKLMEGRDWASAATWLLALGTGVALVALHWFFLLLVVNRWTARPLLAVLFALTAAAVYFMTSYGVYLDDGMMQNVFQTDWAEASGYLDPEMLWYLLAFALLPIALLWTVRLKRVEVRRAAVQRATCLAAALAAFAAGLMVSTGELIPLFRQEKELRYLVTPANFVHSTGRVAFAAGVAPAHAKAPIAPDARLAPREAGRKPLALILVVGESVRAASWGLSGYTRDTTPELRRRNVINFAEVKSCGTDTATSVPCMFSALGRARYDERRIKASESLLHLLARLGVAVLWRDNQSGCKGVCDGLAFERPRDAESCDANGCYDEVLLAGLRERIAAARGDALVVLHMLGNHGPAYYQRYPAAFRRWQPTCDSARLAGCSREALLNTYDNAVLYADHILAKAIDALAGVTTHDTALLYVSDHGESLGEHQLYLHGIPYRIAPDEQTQVPMVLWLSPALRASARVDAACVVKRASAPASHDNLFHSVLGLFGVQTAAYREELDVMRCR